MSEVRLCTEILSTGTRCTQIALRGKPWCRMHADAGQRERNADARQHVALIAAMDMFALAITLGGTVRSLRSGEIPPLHAQAIFDAAIARLERLIEEQSELAAQCPARNTHQHNRLQVVPAK